MGRIAGTTSAETKDRVLASAAAVFAQKGYDGASISEIATDAGVTGGAIYAHFPSKADLFVAALHAHGSPEVEALIQPSRIENSTIRMIQERGVSLIRKDDDADDSLIVEAIVAAKRHPEVLALLSADFTTNEAILIELLNAAKASGAIDATVRVDAVSRFLVMISLGSLLVRAMDLPAVDEDDWTALIADLVGRFSTRPTTN